MRRWLVILKPQDDAGIEQEYRYSAGLEEPWRVNAHERIATLPTLSIEVLTGGLGRGGSTAGVGALSLLNSDGALDDLLGLAWLGMPVELYRADLDRPLSLGDFTLRAQLAGDAITQSADGLITLGLKDLSGLLDVPVLLERYAGTGDAEGTAEFEGKMKPFAIGPQFNVPLEGRFIDRAALIAQVHSRAMGGVLYDAGDPRQQGVTDKGVPLIDGGNYASFAALKAADLSSTTWDGKYITCNAEGLIRLARVPKGVVCVDFEGDADAGDGGYVELPGAVIQRVLNALWTGSEITADAAALADLDSDFPHPVKLYVDTEGVLVSDLIETVALSIGAAWWVDELATLRTALFEFSGAVADLRDWQAERPELLDAWPRWNDLVVGYAAPSRVMSEDELAPDVIDAGLVEAGADKTADHGQTPAWLTALIASADIDPSSVESVLDVLNQIHGPNEAGADNTANQGQAPSWLTALIGSSDINPASIEAVLNALNMIGGPADSGATKNPLTISGSAPSPQGVGHLWYSTSTQLLKKWTGSAWVLFAPAGGSTVTPVSATGTGTTTATATITRDGSPVTIVVDADITNSTSEGSGTNPFPVQISLKRGSTTLKTWAGLSGYWDNSLSIDIVLFGVTFAYVDTNTGTGSTNYTAAFSAGSSYTNSMKVTATITEVA